MSADRTPSDGVDVCVIGAGPAGALIAHRLAAGGHEVTVLEAGPRFDPEQRIEQMEDALRPAHGRPDIWGMGGERDAFTSSGDRHYPLNHTRVKGVGGSTLHWQGMVMRLHERDFAVASRDGVAADWPIAYDDLRPYYAEAEAALGVAGASDNPFEPPREQPHPMPAFDPSHSDSIFAEACEALGITTHSVPNARNSEGYDGRSACVGYGTCQPVCPSGAKYDATSHVEKAEKAGARVIDRVPVQRLEHDDAGERVTAAVYATPDGETHRQEAREFVLAAGGVETPRLLLLSESPQYPDGLANSSGLVGRYFHEHLFAGTSGVIDRETRQHHVGFNTTESHQFYDEPAAGTDRGIPAADAGADDLGPIKLEFRNYGGPSPVGVALSDGGWGDGLRERISDTYGSHLTVGALVEQTPRRENYVGLDPSRTDDHGNPVPEIHWGLDDRTRRTLRRANAIQETILAELDAEITWQIGPENTGPAFHHMGTTRMGTDPDGSVVDARGQTHDLANLWLAGSSVFPTGGAMNPTLTIAALALRTVDHLESVL
ncbi:glucose-methanol-choline oxidoreductase [Halorhabdus utahensis DSM 12940]|uniref:Glucose-methanol-choline oxidoreductase n=1 Tax=Halorhabdus utahensis (strain DSM 12940 / JCM 11049 / AX-2) TaxID=519442 RepID=C7NSF4_HALUD|nr:GMC family oxidoreductase [Halorhabdus utahensis]ACV12041.1 glucose-methanol-choline oxidoreductase [Halorhabdus utahensis DSM 12940]